MSTHINILRAQVAHTTKLINLGVYLKINNYDAPCWKTWEMM